ncbi:MAG TPA: 3'(2'),5'-bisphosphate nucleotidase CysQ [Gammaproteobacteria bacterium]|nr:3'(2'),5'-bisphosphate nucleotidase CysQ [Gammaproteobacteria bacterium]
MLYRDWIPKILSVALEAAEAIVDIYDRNAYQVKEKLDTSPVTEADLCAHQIIQKGLFSIDPTLPLLSEEGDTIPDEIRSRWSRYWLVDPLDGTREFIKGSGEFTVNIALIENHSPVLGVVVVPVHRHAYWAIQGEGAYAKLAAADPVRIHTNRFPKSPLKVAASRRLNQNTKPDWGALMNRLNQPELVYCGSAWKICLVATGEVDLYPQFGPTSEWDTAAGQCILEAAGGQLVDFAGRPLQYNVKPTLENPAFFAVSDSGLIPICCG